jgi:hypothetical protein
MAASSPRLTRIKSAKWEDRPSGWKWPEVGTPSGSLRVGHLLPSGLDRYLRIFHPFENRIARANDSTSRDLTWRQMADRLGVPFQPSLLHQLLFPYQEKERAEFDLTYGYLAPQAMSALITSLAPFTGTTNVFFFYGHLALVRNPDNEPLMWKGQLGDIWEVKRRADLILRAPMPHCPDYIWPEDGSWYVLVDWDLPTTYVAAKASAAAEIMKRPELEVVEVELTTPINKYT